MMCNINDYVLKCALTPASSRAQPTDINYVSLSTINIPSSAQGPAMNVYAVGAMVFVNGAAVSCTLLTVSV